MIAPLLAPVGRITASPARFPDQLQSDKGVVAVCGQGKWYCNFNTFQGDVSRRKWKEYVNFYAYLVQIADFNIGIILQALKDSGQENDTLVVFLSDHGEMGGSHGLTQKWYQSYEETIHVPLIFSNPGFKAQRTENAKKFKTLKKKLDDLLEEKYSLPSLRECEE